MTHTAPRLRWWQRTGYAALMVALCWLFDRRLLVPAATTSCGLVFAQLLDRVEGDGDEELPRMAVRRSRELR